MSRGRSATWRASLLVEGLWGGEAGCFRGDMSGSPKNYTRTSPAGDVFESLRVYLPQELKQQFAEATKRNGQSMSWVVGEAVRTYVRSAAEGEN